MLIINGVIELMRAVGTDLGWTEWFTIEQEHIDSFAHATRDDEWIHVDARRAETELEFGSTIAHGFLTLGMLGFFVPQLVDVRGVRLSLNYGVDKVRFPAPVRAGSTVRCHGAIAAVDEVAGGVHLALRCTVSVDGSDKPCCVATLLARHYV